VGSHSCFQVQACLRVCSCGVRVTLCGLTGVLYPSYSSSRVDIGVYYTTLDELLSVCLPFSTELNYIHKSVGHRGRSQEEGDVLNTFPTREGLTSPVTVGLIV
jgi:hypothetical protein